MGIFNKSKRAKEKRSTVCLCKSDNWEDISCRGYTSLSQSPEVSAAVDRIADLIASMTIHLMENGEGGDRRIISELSKKVDIEPYRYGTRSTFMHWLVKTLMIDGSGNAVVLPHTQAGWLDDLEPIPAALSSFVQQKGGGYKVLISGKEYDPDDVLHFVLNPDSYYPWKGAGHTVTLSSVANNLKQAAATEQGFLKSKWKPSIIIKVDALTDEFASPEGRRRLLEDYADTAEAGEPWLIPAEQFSVDQVKPLTLSDLALADFVELDRKSIASILGVPAYVLGVGEFKRDEWNNFISSKIMPIAQGIEQELTKKLLYSPSLYFRFNIRSLYSYDLKDLASIAGEQYAHGIMTGNEVRDWIGLSPIEGLDELVILENYIPVQDVGNQAKIERKGASNGATDD